MSIASVVSFRSGRWTGLLASLAVLAVLGGTAAATTVYQVDDGTGDVVLGVSGGGDLLWLNGFTVVPGAENITSIQVAFGHAKFPAGSSFMALLYQGADGSGNPNNGVTLLSSAGGVVAAIPNDTFQTVDIADSIVSGKFFAGILVTHEANQFPAYFDTSSSAGVSWVAVGLAGTINPASPSGFNNMTVYGPAFAGNFMLRAEGESLNGAVPEPLTILALGAGVGSLGAYIRRRRLRAIV